MQSSLPSSFTLPDMKVHDNRWTGFWRSIEKITGNRYTAKCTYCNSELPGHPEKLHSHVLLCTSWSAAAKSNYIKKVNSSISKSSSKSQKKASISSTSDNGDSISSSSKFKRQENLMNWYTKPISQDQKFRIDKKILDAVVYGNLFFKIIENPYIIKLLNELAPNYKPPSSIMDITVALDGWQDISRNSIYTFMALKEDQEYVLDIIDLSSN
ncbi:849_t:CDS:2 [Cetraspora pellucida]|uniref:849_t:CDS:1 n=1 Tax=Cetraspora pellucida TaxID=1433469 RepID=A0ACA9NIG3_9GLOM|nr:849_t:CDS:2 [Cetraspora pellucida]